MSLDESACSAPELIRHIETRYHARHRKQLPLLVEMAERVENIHFGDEETPEGLSELLRRILGEIELHMQKEELILFPAIRNGGGPGIEQPIAALRAAQDDHNRVVAEIRRLTRDLTPPEGACGTWTALYAGVAEFIDDLAEHMRLENDVLFPRFERGARADG